MMIRKLQKKSINYAQVVGFIITLWFGLSIALIMAQLYRDFMPLVQSETQVFSPKVSIITKKVTLISSFSKSGIYFKDKEIKELKAQDFVKEVSNFTPADFEVSAAMQSGNNRPMFRTDLFFEAIPDEYLDVKKNWKWPNSHNEIPVVVPENYLNLYNFGFAQSRGLPVISKGTIEKVPFQLRLRGNGKDEFFNGRIVGFSNKINSILVPQTFIDWANEAFGNTGETPINRLLVEFKNPNDENITRYLNENNWVMNPEEVKMNQTIWLIHMVFIGLMVIAAVIVFLSIGFIVLSILLLFQKKATIIRQLSYLGYTPTKIARYYQKFYAVCTAIGVLLATLTAYAIRMYYQPILQNFAQEDVFVIYIPFALIFLAIIVLFLFLAIQRKVKHTIE